MPHSSDLRMTLIHSSIHLFLCCLITDSLICTLTHSLVHFLSPLCSFCQSLQDHPLMYSLLGLCSVAFHSSAHSLIAVFTHGLLITQSHQQPALPSATIQTESQTLPHFLSSPQDPSNNVLSSSWLLQNLLLWYLSLDHKTQTCSRLREQP